MANFRRGNFIILFHFISFHFFFFFFDPDDPLELILIQSHVRLSNWPRGLFHPRCVMILETEPFFSL